MVSRKRIGSRRKIQVCTFILLTVLLLFLLVWIYNFKNGPHITYQQDLLAIKKDTILSNYQWNNEAIKSISNKQFQYNDFNSKSISIKDEVTHSFQEYDSKCIHLSKCFDFNKCRNGFSVYVHPDIEGIPVSPVYRNILTILRSSLYYTDDPNEACISILSYDTHDRDVISTNFIKKMNSKLKKLPNWNNGQNHIVIVFFSGTWPDYLDTASFQLGKAMIARASSSLHGIRKGYDISIPLIPKDYPIKSIPILDKDVTLLPLHRKYLMSFKGKRYLYGIGSMSRNSLYLIRNKKFVLLTTCRHGKGWEKYKDERCDTDNEEYDRYDYNELLRNSTFCLIPRGRRLGSFRFLESMKFGCIPVLLSNGWDLPFKDLIDWSKFSLNIDERTLLQLPTIIEGLSEQMILSMRQQTLFVYQTYFSSVTSILETMLEEVRERVIQDFKRPYRIWNQMPGALKVDTSFSSSVSRLPFYGSLSNDVQRFTAIILAVSTIHRSSAALFRLIQSINMSKYVDQILVIWLSSSAVPPRNKWPKTKVSLRVVHPPKRSMNARYINMDLIKTDAIFSFDEDVTVNNAEIDFAFSVWLSNPGRLVGFTARSHLYDTTSNSEPSWKYTSKKMNSYSIIQTSNAVFHRYYSHHYSKRLPNQLQEMVNQHSTCESLTMNFLISSLTNKSPIKVTTSSHFKPGSVTKERLGSTFTPESHFATMQKCFDMLVNVFGHVPLVWSKVAMNPVLYKDPVSIVRKKYKKLES